MIGQTLSHYRITEKLGAGGMGEVYKARDERLDRDVAIKVLRGELASEPERLRRFEQEARAASALNHPNIITIYDIRLRQGYGGQVGKTQDIDFIVMEFVEGRTLREHVSGGPLPAEKLLRYATQIAEGLAKAHAAGIIHRDLKPENPIVTSDGYVKILDFGLAKLLPHPGADSEAATITKEGTVAGAVMGTASYMSPEQALGNPLDARTDVFSFGAVLYEMATGRRPFQGNTTAGLFNEILNKTPLSPSSLNPKLPRDFDKITAKALEKDSAKRYASAKEFLSDLATVRVDSPLPEASEQKSIVVLPFENMSPDPEQEYFCDGMTEEIIADLSKIQSLRVISRTSSMQLKGTEKTIGTIGNELNVQYVLEGSVRKAGNSLRITGQLIDSTNDAHLWAEKYSGTLDDVFEIQENVSRSIVDALKVKLTPAEEEHIASRPISNVAAYDYYFKARNALLSFTDEGVDQAIRFLEAGLEAVGDNALLYAGIGYAHILSFQAGWPRHEALLKATENAEHSLHIEPNNAAAHVVMGIVLTSRKATRAMRHLKQALSVDPGNYDALLWMQKTNWCIGKCSEALSISDRLMKLDPLNLFIRGMRSDVHFYEGRVDRAIEDMAPCFMAHPENPLFQFGFAYYLIYAGRTGEVLTTLETVDSASPSVFWSQMSRVLKCIARGDRKEAMALLTDDVVSALRLDAMSSCYLATVYAMLDDHEDALDALENAVDLGFVNYPYLSEHDRFLRELRGNARMEKLLERVKHEWENLES